MSAAQHYKKISLSKQELAHVYKQFVAASQQKILHYLPGSTDQDPLLIEVQNLVNEHITGVFEQAKHAMVVDGHDLGDEDISIKELLSLQPTEEVVPFDAELNQKLRGLIESVERETTEVTRLRRELPQQARDAFEQLVSRTDEEVTAVVKDTVDVQDEGATQDATHGEEDKENSAVGQEDVAEVAIPDEASLRRDFSESIRNLHSLKTQLPRHVSQIESLNETVDFLVEMYTKQRAEQKLNTFSVD